MRNAASALLFAAAISGHLIGSASGEPQFGRFGSRFRRSNLTAPAVETPPSSPSTSPTDTLSPASTSNPTSDEFDIAPFDAQDIPSQGEDHNFFPSTSGRITTYAGGGEGGGLHGVSTFLDDNAAATHGVNTSTFTSHALPNFTPSPDETAESTRSAKVGLGFSSVETTDTKHIEWPSSPSTDASTTSSPSGSGWSSAATWGTGASGSLSDVSANSTGGYWANTTSPVTPSIKTYTKPTETSTPVANATVTSLDVDPVDSCFTPGPGMAETVISVIHTSTITWYGDPEDYTAEFPTVDVPTPCTEPSKSVLISASACTVSTCLAWAPAPTTTAMSTGEAPPYESLSKMFSWTYTFYTTDKNPAVVFPDSTSAPDYGGGDNTLQSVDGHQTATQRGDTKVPDYGGTPNSQGPQSMAQNSKSDVVIEDRPTEVVINTVTITNNPASPSTNVVTVGTDTFTVGPTVIIGAGATVTRQAGNVFVPAPTTTTVGGLGVVVSRSVAVVGGTTFTLGSMPSTQTVDGHVVTIGPSGIGVGGVTVPVAAAASTQVIVAGGELLTAIGQSVVVVEGTTYTYGPGSATITEVVDDDTIYIGPSGVVIDGTTFGGVSATPSQVTYQVVGGATISEIGTSIVEIEGVTYTIGPGTGTTTTVVGGETLTIAPDGITISGGMTLPYPFGPTMTTTLHPGSTATASQASATGGDDEEDSAFTAGRSPDWGLALVSVCIAIGVGFFGFMI